MRLGNGEWHNKDALELFQELPEKSVDLICADLPYGTTKVKFDIPIPFEPMWDGIKRVLKPNGACLLFGNQPFTSALVLSNLPWFRQAIVWDKGKCGSPGLAKVRLMQTVEDVILFSPARYTYNPIMEEGKPYSRKSKNPEGYVGRCNNHEYGLKPRTEFSNTGTRYPKNIIRISRDFSAQQQIHPHQKPVPLYEYLIKTFSNEGDLCLDFCAGSGGFAIACENTNRYWICAEKLKENSDVGEQRVMAYLENKHTIVP